MKFPSAHSPLNSSPGLQLTDNSTKCSFDSKPAASRYVNYSFVKREEVRIDAGSDLDQAHGVGIIISKCIFSSYCGKFPQLSSA